MHFIFAALVPNPEDRLTDQLIRVYRSEGEDAAAVVLADRLGLSSAVTGLHNVQRLERCAEYFQTIGARKLTAALWVALIGILRNSGEMERCAYYFNDLGSFLLDVGDDRAFMCFHNALRLTRSPGRRMRTLGRLGDASVLIRRNHERARRFYKATVLVGDRAGCNPIHIEQAKIRIKELELDREGRHREFDSMRENAARDRVLLWALLRHLKVPSL
jgi:hypothetical protein